MARHYVLRGLLAGLLAALPAFLISKLVTEPQIQAAIDYEDGRDAAMEALRHAAGMHGAHESHELFSRPVQSTLGLAVALLAIGAAYGGFFAVAFGIGRRSLDRSVISSRALALLVAAAGFLTLFLFPALKYPPNPPAVGHEATIGARTTLWLVMVGVSVCGMIVAIWLASALQRRTGWWHAILVGAALFAAVQVIAQVALPPVGHLAGNLAQFGHQATETPLPLRDGATIVYPGFPADVLAQFRVATLLGQLVLWLGIGLAFAELVQRLESPAGRRAAELVQRLESPAGRGAEHPELAATAARASA